MESESHIAQVLRSLKAELPESVTLVAVSKFHPVEAVVEAYSAGQRVFGESRPQELLSKVTSLGENYSDIQWHFIGHLQTNKLKMVLPYVTMVESVDSLRLLSAIDAWCTAAGKQVDVLLECHIASEESKQGFSREEILEIVTGAAGSFPGVRIRGLMGMATFTDDESVIRADFSKLMSIYNEILRLRDEGRCPEVGECFDVRSFGMTGDYRIAVGMGSDMVRIGTLIFGARV